MWNNTLLYTTSHKYLGLYYVYASLLFGLVGTMCSVIIRCELYYTSSRIIVFENHNFYNLLFTLHGLIMIFFLIMPLLFTGFGNFYLPLCLVSTEVIYPNVNNIGFYLLLLSFVYVLLSLVSEFNIGIGWTLYPPLSTSLAVLSPNFINMLVTSLLVSGISSIISVINFVLTLLYVRITIYSVVNIFIYCVLFTSLLLMMALPVLTICLLLVLFDVNLTTSFYNGYHFGDAILYQHLFWFFGHPEVYILIIPALGVISESMIVISHKVLFGLHSMILAIGCIAIIGSIVWAHHMYIVGLESDTKAYFTIATILIAIPTGTKIYNWNSTYEYNLLQLSMASSAFTLAFIMTFTFGGTTGIVLGNSIVDISLHDTYYVVAHFHLVLSVGAIIGILTGLLTYQELFLGNYHLFNNNFILRYQFIAFITGVFLIFVPLHMLGFNVMPRRFPDFPDFMYSWNVISSLASALTLISLLFLRPGLVLEIVLQHL